MLHTADAHAMHMQRLGGVVVVDLHILWKLLCYAALCTAAGGHCYTRGNDLKRRLEGVCTQCNTQS